MRSRFRCASARGLRGAGFERFVVISKFCNRRPSPIIYYFRRHPPFYLEPHRLVNWVCRHTPSNGQKLKGTSENIMANTVANTFGATSTTDEVLSGVNL